MTTLTTRQLCDEDYYGYNSNCYEEGRCSWWWSDVRTHPTQAHPPLSTQLNPHPSQTGSAVRYTIVAVLFTLLFAYFVGGYLHARRRARKNLPPLRYHAWMLRRSTRGHPRYYYQNQPMYTNQQNPYYNNQQNPYYGQQPQHPDSYGMQNSTFAPPPPAYQAGDAPPPVYQPPQGGSKVAADQHYQEVRGGESSEVRAPGAAGAAARGL